MNLPPPSQPPSEPLLPGTGWIGIAALAENRVIGSKGSIPWHLPADFAWFKRVTYGQILLMGRKTFESIGRPLPGRRTIVVSQSGFSAGSVEVAKDLASVKELVHSDARRVFLCGGATLYAQWLPLCSDLLLTHVHLTVDGDSEFPVYAPLFQPLATVFSNDKFHIVHYLHR